MAPGEECITQTLPLFLTPCPLPIHQSQTEGKKSRVIELPGAPRLCVPTKAVRPGAALTALDAPCPCVLLLSGQGGGAVTNNTIQVETYATQQNTDTR